ncbi:XrtA system polysaccharide deacetylase [Erythrobacter sp. HL-111]|uniref:XrtA system polysaccharide deacetylase n=1 Tax=Erythrobacter sp. HL-111 TaxID=1798193 RepID=UPI0006D9B3EE|nr:XrtA system polysaccharide deacetylase [Erythrobacter sp. HL-111]KPP96585.1 MAG: putative xylanase/chitin deacetylase [Erythrobacteraceae bacterium HL-111]SDS02815.1 polysaccharide deacetylase family protein, PEP-CTERM locus subfamily [Erythrobacter sp. HL-111]
MADAPDPAPVVNGLSVDVEDWFQVGAFETVIDRADWDSLASRVEGNVDALLDLFARHRVRATFFTLGWVAERRPALIRRIAEAGHEIASHGYDHARVFTLSRAAFAADIARARRILEDASGARVAGYRAPSFSIDARTPWAFEELATAGYAYSSSVAPVVHDHYGWPEAPRFAFRPVAGADLVELPVTTALVGRRRVAAGGGGFFRVLPYGFSRWAIRQVNAREGRPAMFYFHPWEIDAGQPRVAGAPLRSRLRHYTGLARMTGKLAALLGDFAWDRVDAIAPREAERAADWPVARLAPAAAQKVAA